MWNVCSRISEKGGLTGAGQENCWTGSFSPLLTPWRRLLLQPCTACTEGRIRAGPSSFASPRPAQCTGTTVPIVVTSCAISKSVGLCRCVLAERACASSSLGVVSRGRCHGVVAALGRLPEHHSLELTALAYSPGAAATKRPGSRCLSIMAWHVLRMSQFSRREHAIR